MTKDLFLEPEDLDILNCEPFEDELEDLPEEPEDTIYCPEPEEPEESECPGVVEINEPEEDDYWGGPCG